MTSYRVVHAPAVVVDEAETQRCPYCPRRGRCQSCLDSRRILLNDGLSWPVAVVEVPSTEARSEAVLARASGDAGTREFRPGHSPTPSAPSRR